MGKLSVLIKIFVLATFFGILYLLGVYKPIVQQFTAKVMNTSTEVVAGESVIDTDKLKTDVPQLPEKIKTDINNSVEGAKQTGLDVTIGDILHSVGRVGKIIQDFRSVQEFTGEKLKELTK